MASAAAPNERSADPIMIDEVQSNRQTTGGQSDTAPRGAAIEMF
jgi:hypothetical protein